MADDITQSPGSLLADQMYGTPEVTPEVETPEVISETPEVTPEGETPEIVAETPEGETPEVEEIELTSVEQLAEHFEFDPEMLQNLTIKQKVNGKDIEVSLSDALTTHRQVTAGDTYLSDAKQKAKTMIDEAGQEKDRFTASVATFGALIKSLSDEMDADVKGVDWAALRRDDPAEYAAKTEEVRSRKERMDELKASAVSSYKDAIDKNEASINQSRIDSLPEQHEILLDRIPEWKDEVKAGAERDKLIKYLTNDGYSDGDIKMASFNGKLLSMAVKAMRYDQSKEKSQAAKKKVVKIPKIMKPGVKKPAPKPNGLADDPVSILYGSG